MRRVILWRRLIVIALFFALIFSIGLFFFPPKFSSKSPGIAQESVRNGIRIKATFLPTVKGEPFRFRLRLESFEHQDILKLNPKDISLLLDAAQTPYKPVSWTEEESSDYVLSGILEFPPFESPPSRFSLLIYDLQERTFVWTISQ